MQIKTLNKLNDSEFENAINKKISIEELRKLKNSQNYSTLSEERQKKIQAILDFFDGIIPEELLWEMLIGKEFEATITAELPNKLYRRAVIRIENENHTYQLLGMVKLSKITSRFKKGNKIKLKLTNEFGVFQET